MGENTQEYSVQNQSNAETTSKVITLVPTYQDVEISTESELELSEPEISTEQPTHWQPIDPVGSQTEHEVVKGYDEKYNMEEEDSFENKDKEQEEERQKMESERSMSPTMSLVIGIIIGSFTAMILIVIIVLKWNCCLFFVSFFTKKHKKVRTGVDITEYKQQEEMQRYQFSSPSVPDREEFPVYNNHCGDTASTSLIDGGGKGSHQNNGFFNGGLTTALNGDRARLFKKANNYGRPVREWYV